MADEHSTPTSRVGPTSDGLLGRVGMAVLLALTLANAGCTKTSQTPLMKKLSPRELSSQELRARLYGAVDGYGRLVSNRADQIRQASADPAVHAAALRWKMYAASYMMAASFRVDPLMGYVDSWTFATQMRMAFEPGGALVDLFPGSNDRALETSREGEALFTVLAPVMMRDPDVMRQQVVEFSTVHPVGGLYAGRTSALDAAGPGSQYRTSAFGVEEMQSTIEDLNARMPLLMEAGIEQTFSRMELLWEEKGLGGSLAFMVADMRAIDSSLVRIGDGVDSIAGVRALLDSLSWVVQRERRAVLLDLERQRVETLDALIDQRIAVLDDLDAHFSTLLETLSSERALIMARADSIASNKVEMAVVGLKDVADHVFWRVLQLLAITAVVALIVGWLLMRGRGQTSSSGATRS